MLRGLLDPPSALVLEHGALRRHDDEVAIVEKDDVARVREHGGHVGRHEVLAVAQPDDERRAVAHGDDRPRIVGRDEHQREQPAQHAKRAAHGAFQPVAAHLALDDVRDHLGVGLGDEPVALGGQLALQLEVVLDDAVVDDDDAPGAIAVGVRVLLGRPAVRGPAGVADAVVAVEGGVGKRQLEVRQLARRAAQRDGAVADDGDPGRVVAPVLETPEALDEDRDDRLAPDVTDDATHGGRSPLNTKARGTGSRLQAPGRNDSDAAHASEPEA